MKRKNHKYRTIQIHRELHSKVAELAKEIGMKIHSLIEVAILEYLEKKGAL